MSGADTQRSYRRIATEEAFAPSDMIASYKSLITGGATNDPGFESLMGYFLFNESPRTNAIVERLQDLGDRRIGDMDPGAFAGTARARATIGRHIRGHR